MKPRTPASIPSCLLIVGLVSAGSLAGCDGNSNGSQPTQTAIPEISNLTLSPESVMYMDGDGSIMATAKVEFVDADLDIASMQVNMCDGTHQAMPLGPIDTASGVLTQEVPVPTANPGACAVEVWLVDAAAHASNHLDAVINVQSEVPAITELDPNEVQAGSGEFDLNVTGSGFVMGSVVTWDGADRTTEYVSGEQVVAAIPETDLQTPRIVTVRVRNPDPTTGLSNELFFVVADSPSPEPDGLPTRITEGLDGSPPNGPSVNGGMDWNGDHVVFASKASNLVEGDANDAYDLFYRKTCVLASANGDCAPATSRAVMGIGGAEPNGDIGWTVTSPENSLAVSFNGRFAAFVSSASNLVPDDTNGVDDVFLVDSCNPDIVGREPTDCTTAIIRVSLSDGGSQSTAPAGYPAVADDGRYVLFVSADPDLVAGDTNGVADVFLRDTCRGVSGCTPSTTRVSVANNGAEANAASGEPAFTGRYVAFSSLASNLVAGDSNGLQDVFLRDTCIGESRCVPSTRLVSVGRLGDPADGPSSDPQVSYGMGSSAGYEYHGRMVAFVSTATNLVEGDTNGASDVFERDLCASVPGCTPSTIRISVTSTGGEIAGDSWSPDFLRWDGETIPFVTAADGVVPDDVNGLADVYVRHHCPLGSPDYCRASTRRVSIGANGAQTDGDSYAPRMSHHPFGAWAITYVSEASNILPDGVPIPNDGSIYMDIR